MRLATIEYSNAKTGTIETVEALQITENCFSKHNDVSLNNQLSLSTDKKRIFTIQYDNSKYDRPAFPVLLGNVLSIEFS